MHHLCFLSSLPLVEWARAQVLHTRDWHHWCPRTEAIHMQKRTMKWLRCMPTDLQSIEISQHSNQRNKNTSPAHSHKARLHLPGSCRRQYHILTLLYSYIIIFLLYCYIKWLFLSRKKLYSWHNSGIIYIDCCKWWLTICTTLNMGIFNSRNTEYWTQNKEHRITKMAAI
jgi:hypothetical protein